MRGRPETQVIEGDFEEVEKEDVEISTLSSSEADKEIRSKREEKIERQAKGKELREEGKTQREIAEELGVSVPTVKRDARDQKNGVHAKNDPKPTRKVIQYKITQYTKPETAAKRIREVFGVLSPPPPTKH